MKPASFKYFAPDTLEEALELLEQHGDDAKVLAGGQSLVPIMNMRLARPAVLIDLNRIENMSYLQVEEEQVRIGALTRHRALEKSDVLRETCPIANEATRYIGHVQIRTRGTVGGSIAHADPAAELPMVLSCLGGEVVVRSKNDERIVTPDEFFLTYLTTTLDPTEIVTEVRFPVLSEQTGWAVQELTRRHGDFAIVAVAAALDLDEQGKIANARMALAGVGGTPMVAHSTCSTLIGEQPSIELLREAAEQVVQDIEPESDVHGSAEYRSEVSKVLAFRTLREALGRIRPDLVQEEAS